MKFAFALGTRPEIIKMSPLIRECQKQNIDFFIIHSNQHYSIEMDQVFFNELELPKPKYNLGVGSNTHAKMTAKIIEKLEPILIKEKPDIIFVQGDTNTVMAAALTASKLGIKIAHIEAGLRSYDRTMPEEINRIITDHISDYLFAPTERSAKILKSEGIKLKKTHVVGNTIVDAVYQNLEIAKTKVDIIKKLNLLPKKYFLLTIHRPSNVDIKKNLNNILKAINKIYKTYRLPIVFPIHPRTKKQIEYFNIKLPIGVKKIRPVGFLEMLRLEQNAKLILTDSGGIQEEACILKVPSITLRENTERPETLEVRASILAGNNPDKVYNSCKIMLNKKTGWINPFGNGISAKKIISIIKRRK